jgi:hypothetical protein
MPADTGDTSVVARHMRNPIPLVAVLAVVLMVLCVNIRSASAAFTRKALPAIQGTSVGPFPPFEHAPLEHAGGVAVDKADELLVGVGEYPNVTLDRFEPAYSFISNGSLSALPLGSEALTSPGSLAVSDATDRIYTSGDIAFEPVVGHNNAGPHVEAFDSGGAFLSRSAKLGLASEVAVDNSTGLASSGSVYAAHEATNSSDGKPPGVEKFTGELGPGTFEREKQSSPPFYLEGNEIVGVPQYPETVHSGERPICSAQKFSSAGTGAVVGGVAVDGLGNVFILVKECEVHTAAVLEYAASGQFVRAITGVETPGLNGPGAAGWGEEARLTGLGVDPVSGNLLVAVTNVDSSGGVLDEFDAGGKFVSQLTEGVVEGHASRFAAPTAIAADSKGDVYVADQKKSLVFVFGPGKFLPSVRESSPTTRTRSSAVLNGFVNPEGQKLAGAEGCEFQYVTQDAFEANVEAHGVDEAEGFSSLASGGETACVPGAGEIAPDNQFHAVHAEISEHVTSGVTYRFRLVATSEGEHGGAAAGQALAFTAPHAPAVEPGSTAATNVSSESAQLNARVQPLGANTSYHFEYDTAPYLSSASHGVSVPVPSRDIGAGGPTGSAIESVLDSAGPLMPGSVYYFRVVAASEVEGAVEETDGEQATFTTAQAPVHALPDGRAYELVTPANKGGAQDMFAVESDLGGPDSGFSSNTGDEFLFETLAAFGPFPGSEGSAYMFKRCGPPQCSAPRWVYTSLADPTRGLQAVHQPTFDPRDFSRVAFADETGAPTSEEGRRAIGLVGAAGEPYEQFFEGEASQGGLVDPEEPKVVGSEDLSRLVLQSKNHTLAPGASAQDKGSTALYSYSAGLLRLLNANEEGEPISLCGAAIGRVAVANSGGGAHNAVSSNGASVFFTMPDPNMQFEVEHVAATKECWNKKTDLHSPQLWVAVEGPKAKQIEISKPEAGLPAGSLPPSGYVGAAADGSRAFFLSEAELTHDDEGIHDLELYEWRAEGVASAGTVCASEDGCLTRISHGETGKDLGEVFTVPAIADTGAAVYFTSFAKLTSDAPLPGEEFGHREVDVYRYDTTTATVAYVSTVLTSEAPEGSHNGDWFKALIGHNFAPEPLGNWYTPPSGDYLLFPTTREITSYKTAGCLTTVLPDTEAEKDDHCEELYRYAYSVGGPGSVLCVSCNPTGAPPLSHVQIESYASHENPGAGPPRAMSDGGAYVFFDTADALVPADTNGLRDVYEWEADGTGGCALPQGCVSLISSGEDAQPSFFLATNSTGSDVFFGTHAHLVPEDTDTAGDIYDARICAAANPCATRAAGEVTQCEGDACQTPPPPLVVQTPATLTSTSSGNLSPPTAKPPHGQTRLQKLKAALRACKRKPKRRRPACERHAHRLYGAKASNRTANGRQGALNR